MFIGHFAVGFASKRAATRASLGAMFAAAQFADLLWPILLLAGVERVAIEPGATAFTPLVFAHYPWSHSLAMLVLYGVIAGLAYGAWKKDGRAGLVIGLLVVSHWILDYVTHRPDLPLYPGGTQRYGLGLWNSPTGTVAVESVLFLAGLWGYLTTTHARDRIGSLGIWALIALLVLINFANVFGPPPESVRALAYLALAGWLLVPAAAWVDAHREHRGRPKPATDG
jgi:membrane-bound metal-dependent hydrolase YbcI (DUF457 family)